MTDLSPDVQSVVIERTFPHAPARVWRALTQPHLMADWLMRNDFQPVRGHRFTLTGDWGGVLDCEVLEIEPERRLAYSWNHVHEDPAFDLRSVVTFTLTPAHGGSHLRVEQTGFRPGQKQASGGARVGWAKMLESLDGLLARTGDDA
ncbi:MAG TPA: SRPBCC domain-containing protein [Brevundimonas sp.]|jgi:uncharacterized protein YndB with AHSA1/START domain|uniref:SRPBCC family protein n=1 Tax=Brevundimonas sp. TaxID=1871086 RepID=UPI002E11321D|nr:SRPBCC domain-containing protein [Brevundimonas sp.]